METQMLCRVQPARRVTNCSNFSAGSTARMSTRAGAAREVARGVQGKEPESKSCSAGQRSCFARQVGDRDGAPSWPALVEEMLCRDVVALSAGQGSLFLAE